MERGRRGRKRQLAVEDEDWQLIREGVGTADACRRVGITRKTGYLWRANNPSPGLACPGPLVCTRNVRFSVGFSTKAVRSGRIVAVRTLR